MSDYLAKIKIQNGRIHQLMKKAGLNTASELSRACGVCASQVGKVLNFKEEPMNKNGTWKNHVLKIADTLGCLPDEMFSPEQLTLKIPSNRRDYLISEEEVQKLANLSADPAPPLEIEADHKLIANIVEGALHILTNREQNIIKDIYGFGEGRNDPMSLEECGEKHNLSRERIRQIHSKAIRKLRTPQIQASIWKPAGFLEDDSYGTKELKNRNWSVPVRQFD